MTFEPITALVQRAVERFGERVALDCAGTQFTYSELDERAGRVAATLAASGARKGDIVGVLADNRGEVVAGILGVLRIGGVVMPLDTHTPPQVLRHQVTDATPGHVVLDTAAKAVADDVLTHAAPTATWVVMDALLPDGGAAPTVSHAPDDPATLFFTSGSTGRPKGIVGRLSGIDHFIRWEADQLGAGPGWRVSNLTSPSFDAVLRDIFLPLTTGGTLCAPDADVILDPAALCRWLDEQHIDVVHCVPSVWRGLLGAATSARFASLRCVALSGEPVAPSDVSRWFDLFGERIRLLNLYGPSETLMTKTWHEIRPSDAERESVPIGRPMPDTDVVLLDDQGSPVPQGAIGEIYLRTPHRSLGYHNQPEATGAAFVPNPAGETSDVLYRTGDFGRLGDDGLLEFLGRTDHQVKIGGVRIELGGVESVLRAHPAVADAAVVVSSAADGLCAFVELAGESDPDTLTEHVAERLPSAAVPSVIVPLPELPRTISGKINRKALPVPSARRQPPRSDGPPPSTPMERTIARMWAAVLNIGTETDQLDVTAGFFASGGSSLLVIELLSRISGELRVDVALQRFLAEPTIAALARLVEDAAITDDALDDLLDDSAAGSTREEGLA
ncbi:non-ribosomal peptide synthetase [Haloechinothrix halophila]|uniref:non-ribosomal peptide synthetase n=1 Tax=Haloechinothrix halophila TaxID=1069073 RepID=UPI00040D9344|nr:non-ribosomal peptide synthetase [Haloechinothrix halophila]